MELTGSMTSDCEFKSMNYWARTKGLVFCRARNAPTLCRNLHKEVFNLQRANRECSTLKNTFSSHNSPHSALPYYKLTPPHVTNRARTEQLCVFVSYEPSPVPRTFKMPIKRNIYGTKYLKQLLTTYNQCTVISREASDAGEFQLKTKSPDFRVIFDEK